MRKWLISRVLPGVPETLARPLRPVSILTIDDLPTLLRPMKANSGSESFGSCERRSELHTNCALLICMTSGSKRGTARVFPGSIRSFRRRRQQSSVRPIYLSAKNSGRRTVSQICLNLSGPRIRFFAKIGKVERKRELVPGFPRCLLSKAMSKIVKDKDRTKFVQVPFAPPCRALYVSVAALPPSERRLSYAEPYPIFPEK